MEDHFLNRGNAYYYLNKRDEACRDCTNAVELGVKQAESMIQLHCTNY
jgi:hypothetical protein